jgi:PAP2 superfamily protein
MTQSTERSATVAYVRSRGILPAIGRAGIEVTLIAVLYVFYVVTRTFASTAFAPARGHALDILTFEKGWRIDFESWLNNKFFEYDWLGVFGSYWYATTHYLVTLFVLIWLYRHSAAQYVTARRALVLASLAGLTFYLLMPTAPPRLIDGGFHDILSLHSNIGWWSENGSAPKGMANVTNELAAFPSLHAGWALWVAIVLIRAGVPKIVQVLGVLYAATMAIVIVGTANHWVLDAVVGWVVILIAFGVAVAWERKGPTLGRDAYVLVADNPQNE